MKQADLKNYDYLKPRFLVPDDIARTGSNFCVACKYWEKGKIYYDESGFIIREVKKGEADTEGLCTKYNKNTTRHQHCPSCDIFSLNKKAANLII